MGHTRQLQVRVGMLLLLSFMLDFAGVFLDDALM
jgi:hypothetical protein